MEAVTTLIVVAAVDKDNDNDDMEAVYNIYCDGGACAVTVMIPTYTMVLTTEVKMLTMVMMYLPKYASKSPYINCA